MRLIKWIWDEAPIIVAVGITWIMLIGIIAIALPIVFSQGAYRGVDLGGILSNEENK